MNVRQNAENMQENTQNRGECVHKCAYELFYLAHENNYKEYWIQKSSDMLLSDLYSDLKSDLSSDEWDII